MDELASRKKEVDDWKRILELEKHKTQEKVQEI